VLIVEIKEFDLSHNSLILDLGPPKLFILVVISQDYLALSANSIILSRYFTPSILGFPLEGPS
jgi:hypothetical protein